MKYKVFFGVFTIYFEKKITTIKIYTISAPKCISNLGYKEQIWLTLDNFI